MPRPHETPQVEAPSLSRTSPQDAASSSEGQKTGPSPPTPFVLKKTTSTQRRKGNRKQRRAAQRKPPAAVIERISLADDAATKQKQKLEEPVEEIGWKDVGEFFAAHTPLYRPIYQRWGTLGVVFAFLLIGVLVFGYIYKLVMFMGLLVENNRAPFNDVVVLKHLEDAQLEQYARVVHDDEDRPDGYVVRDSLPWSELLNMRFLIYRYSASGPPFSSYFWEPWNAVHVIGAMMIQVVFWCLVATMWICYYTFGHRLEALVRRFSGIQRLIDNPGSMLMWYVCIGLGLGGYVFKWMMYTFAVFNTYLNAHSTDTDTYFGVHSLGLDTTTYHPLTSLMDAHFSIQNDRQGVLYHSVSFWVFWDATHLIGALGLQAVMVVALPFYYCVTRVTWFFVRLILGPVIRRWRNAHVKRD